MKTFRGLMVSLLIGFLSTGAFALFREYAECRSGEDKLVLGWEDGWVLVATNKYGRTVAQTYSRDKMKVLRQTYNEAVKQMWKLPSNSNDTLSALPGLKFQIFNTKKNRHYLALSFAQEAREFDFIVFYEGYARNSGEFEKLLKVTNQTW